MKKFMTVLMVAGLLAPSLASAETASTANVPVTAAVDSILVLDMAIAKENVNGTLGPATLTSMPFTMTRSGSNALGGDAAYHVFLGANTSGRNYNITSTLGNLTNANGVILPDAMLLDGVSVTNGSGAAVPGGTFPADTAQSAKGTDKAIYSNNQGRGAVIELVYGISGGNANGTPPFTGWQPVPPDQASGTYTAAPALKFTITTI